MGSSTNVWILGGYQSDFSRNVTREGLDFADLTGEAVDATLAAAPAFAFRFRNRLPRRNSIRTDFRFILSDARQHVRHQPPCGRAEVDAVLETDKVDLAFNQFLEQGGERDFAQSFFRRRPAMALGGVVVVTIVREGSGPEQRAGEHRGHCGNGEGNLLHHIHSCS